MGRTRDAMAGQRVVTARIRHRARVSDPAGWLLGSPLDQVTDRAGLVAGAGGVSGTGGDQPAQRARLDVERAGDVPASWLAELMRSL